MKTFWVSVAISSYAAGGHYFPTNVFFNEHSRAFYSLFYSCSIIKWIRVFFFTLSQVIGAL